MTLAKIRGSKITGFVIGIGALLWIIGTITGTPESAPVADPYVKPTLAAPTKAAPPAPKVVPFTAEDLFLSIEEGKPTTMEIVAQLARANPAPDGKAIDVEQLRLKSVGGAKYGGVKVTGKGNVLYTPGSSFTDKGSDAFRYAVSYLGTAYEGTVHVMPINMEADMDFGTGGGHDDRQCVGRKWVKVCG